MTTKKGDPNRFPRYKHDSELDTVVKGPWPQKTLHNSNVSGARINVKDIQVVGDSDMFKLLCKASSEKEGWMKSTKAMETSHGCLVQVTTQQRNPDGSYSVAEALTFVPGVIIAPDSNSGRKLKARI